MKGSAGVNNKKYIKATSFDSVYKTLLTEFYVNKFRNAKELEEEYGFRPSTFSETKDKIDSAIAIEQNGNGEPITISMITENHSIRNPFFELYSRCNDKDSEFALYVLFTFWSIEQIWKELSCRLENLDTKDKKLVEQAIQDAQKDEYNPICCSKFGCIPALSDKCSAQETCKLTRWYKMCGQYGKYRGLTKKEILNYLENLFIEDSETRESVSSITQMDGKTLTSKLQNMVNVGFLTYDENNRYHLSEISLHGLFAGIEDSSEDELSLQMRFKALVEFFSEIRPLGEIGYRIGENLQVKGYHSPFRFKDRYVINAINDYNLIDLLYALEHHMTIRVVCLKKKEPLVVVPLQIRVSAKDGREVLVYYSPSQHSVCAIWLNLIRKIEFGTLKMSEEDSRIIEQECETATAFLPYIWTFGLEDIENGNCTCSTSIPLTRVHVLLSFGKDRYLLERLKRELQRACDIQEDPETNNVEIDIIVANENDVRTWLSAYELQITSYQSEPVKLDLKTGEISARELDRTEVRPIAMRWIPSSVSINPSSTKLFCPETGYAFQSYTRLLQEAIEERYYSKRKLDSVIDEMTANTEKMSQHQAQQEQIRARYSQPLRLFFEGVNEVLNHEDYSNTLASRCFEMPLSILERNWLLEVIGEPMASLFIDGEEVDKFRQYLSLEEEEYVFRMKNVCYCDYAKNDLTVQTNIFRTVLQAVIQSKLLYCDYTNNKSANNNGERYLESIYYSNRQNTFRINTYHLKVGNFKIDRLDYVSNPRLLREASIDECKQYEEIIEKGLQYGTYLPETEKKEARIGLMGQTEEIRMRFLHELSAYTVSCRRIAKIAEEHARTVSKILRIQAINAGSFSCCINGQEFVGCRLRKAEKEYLQIENLPRDIPSRVAYADLKVLELDSMFDVLPCVAPYPDESFEYIVTLRYPGNDYIEVVETLSSYRDVFVIANRVMPKMSKGDSKRLHSVARAIVEREEEFIELKKRK